jgi:uncharacterized SAM-binding protein YcdF (DUF218 family)
MDHRQRIDNLAEIVWNYHRLGHRLRKCDCILALGSTDTRVAECGASLFLDGLGDYLVISGGFGRISGDRFDKPEAEVFSDVAATLGVPREKMILEEKATNTGENATLTHAVLRGRNLRPRSLILVHKPYMERRAYATFRRQWPDRDAEFLVASPEISYRRYFTAELSRELVIRTMVGDLRRIREYPERGFQVEQEIPDKVWRAYEELAAFGYADP